jgi:hypothetical protein
MGAVLGMSAPRSVRAVQSSRGPAAPCHATNAGVVVVRSFVIAGVISARARAGYGVARWNRCKLPRESSANESNSL